MGNPGLDKAQAWIKIARWNINNLRYADDTTLIAGSKEEIKSLLKVKDKSEKVGLKLNIQKTKIMATVPQLHGNKWKGTEEPLDENGRGEWKTGLKLNIQQTKIMASGPITSRQIDREQLK